MLIANREDIDSSSQWNVKIRDFIASAFSETVDYFNTTSFRHTWPRFLPAETRDFFGPVAGEIRETLKGRRILEGEDGQIHEPPCLQYIGEYYRLGNAPLILTEITKPRYLSRHYNDLWTGFLEHLGVEELDFDGFLTDLENFMEQRESEFRNQSPEWYSHLSRTLWFKAYSNRERVAALKLIPLSDGEWTSGVESKDRLFYLPSDSATLIPKGTEVMFIHAEAAKDSYRCYVFSELGAKTFSPAEVSPFIVRLHTSLSSANMISGQDLVEHLVFLFRAGWHNRDDADLWVMTTAGYCRASEAYLRAFEPNGQNFDFPVLHQDYSVIIAGDEQSWALWLKEQLEVYEVPRLVRTHGDEFELSEDMKCIIRNLPSGEFLRLMRDHWDTYSKWLGSDDDTDDNEGWNLSKRALREYIMTSKVECYGGHRYPLKETTLPTVSLREVEGSDSLPLLDIPDPLDKSWSFLEQLGVKIKMDANVYLQCLRALKQKGRPMRSSWLYDKIQETIAIDAAVVQ